MQQIYENYNSQIPHIGSIGINLCLFSLMVFFNAHS